MPAILSPPHLPMSSFRKLFLRREQAPALQCEKECFVSYAYISLQSMPQVEHNQNCSTAGVSSSAILVPHVSPLLFIIPRWRWMKQEEMLATNAPLPLTYYFLLIPLPARACWLPLLAGTSAVKCFLLKMGSFCIYIIYSYKESTKLAGNFCENCVLRARVNSGILYDV